MNNKPVRIIGFDLGHGEISLAKIQANHNHREPPIPMLLHRKKYQPAAIAYHASQGVLFGEPAFLDGENGFEIGFKKKPFSFTPHDSQTLQKFVRAIRIHLKETSQLDEEYNNHFFVGCPSGWKNEEVAAYEELLLLNSCLPVVKVVPESRAALMHARESGKFTVGELSESVLVIDVGSSTTDFTLIKGGDSKPIDSGVELGASLIDKAILDYTLDEHPDKQHIQEIFQKTSAYRHKCELRCRKAKEEYFSYKSSYKERMVNVGYEKFQKFQKKDIRFEPQINESIMDKILNQKFEALSNKDWITCFRDLLTKKKEEFDNKEIRVSAVFLTGNASKMTFISEIVEDVFLSSRFQPDSEPELSIAFGLARWGRIDLHTQNFLEKINQTIDKELEDLVKRNFYTLKNSLAEILTDELLNEVIKPCMYAWREGDIQTVKDLEPEMKKRASEWVEKPQIKERIEKKILTWMNEVQEKFLETEINPICEQYKLQSGKIQLEPITSETVTKDLQDVINKDKLTPTLDFLTDKLLPIVVGIVPTLIFGLGGLLIGILAAIAVILWGGEKSKEFISNQDILGWIHKLRLTDKKIEKIINEKQSELNDTIKTKLDEKRTDLIEHCVQHMKEQIKAGIKKQADKASFLIA